MRHWVYLASTAIVTAACASQASAQDAPQPAETPGTPAGDSQVGDEGGIADIVVTAQRRAENLQDVPISVSAVTGEDAQAQGILTSNDLQFAVPGLNITRTTSATNIFVRGIGTAGGATGQDSAVAVFIDGVYLPSMSASTFSLNNIERIEVLKGPQGTLYGRNATGGAVNIITRLPSEDASVEARIGYGNLDTIEASFYGTTGIAPGVAIDLAGYFRDQGDGFGRNTVSGRGVNATEDINIRSRLLIEFSPDTRLILSGDYSNNEGSIGIAFRGIPSSTLLDGSIGYSGRFFDSDSEFQPFLQTELFGGAARFEHEFGNFNFVSLTAYRGQDAFQRVEVDGTSLPIIDAPLFSDDGQFTQEFQLGYTGDQLNWIVGLYYLNSFNEYDPFQILGFAVAPLERAVTLSRQETKSYAAFGQLTWEFVPDTNLTLGARYTRDERDLEASTFGVLPGGTQIPLGPDISDSANFGKPTWRIALDRRFSPQVLAYASYSRGFKSGVYNLTAPSDPVVRPETLDAFELGIKTDLLRRHLRFNAAAFYYTYDNIQLTQIEGTVQRLLNAASAEVWGLDTDFEALVTENLTISGGVVYLHNEYTSFPGAPFSTPVPGAGNAIVPGDASGNRMILVPDWTANISVNYTAPLFGGELATNVSYAYNDGFFWAADNRVRQDSFNLFNAQMMWTSPDGTYDVRIFGRNLFNEKYLVAVNENNTGDIGTPAPGRSYGVSFGVHF